MRLFPLVFATTLFLSSSLSQASTPDKATAAHDRLYAKWQTQFDSAARDEKLVSMTRVDFLAASDGRKPPADADSALTQLRLRFPDYRLKYDGPNDRCRVLAGLQGARDDVLTRKSEALAKQQGLLLRKMLYDRIKLNLGISAALGQSFQEEELTQAFLIHLADVRSDDDEIETSFSAMSFLDSPSVSGCD